MERITSRKNPLAVHIKKLGTSRSYRAESGEFLCDGIKLLEDAAGSRLVIPLVFTAVPIPFPISVETRVYHVDRNLVDSLSPLKNAQGLLFTCKMSAQESPKPQDLFVNGGTHILLDNVQDPGNVGAIVRTANAFDIKSVILYGACADAYNPKTIRASMGAIFRQAIFKMDLKQLTGVRDSGVKFIGTTPDHDSGSVINVDFSNAIVAIGSEGNGLSGEIISLCHEMTTIPIAAGCESLNAAVAAGIIMWEASASELAASDRTRS